MLEKVDLKESVSREKYKMLAKGLRERLAALQQPIKQQNLPVIVLFEGWGGAGKGGLVSELILNFDPRGFKVYSILPPTPEERREPFLWRYWQKLPKKGQMAVLDRSWYTDVSTARLEESLGQGEITRRLNDINRFEKLLTDGGYLVIKFFVHITRKTQKERFEALGKDKNTEWRVTELDWKRNRQYDKYCQAFDEMLGYTDTTNAPWNLISGMDRKSAALEVFQVVGDRVEAALQKQKEAEPVPEAREIRPGAYRFLPMPKLADIQLDKKLDNDEYEKRLKEQQDLLRELHGKLYRKKVPVIIACEGWDAAGKGGDIRRMAKALDPRGYEVVPIAAPTPEEAARHYLWRFWKSLPRDGHVAIFDRTWYGRVLVERVEGFCTEEEWRRAYREINEFEHQLADWGAVILKFWLQIDQDEQLRRFNDRQDTPSKQWKITEEDWRNRAKWPEYEKCINDMLKYTSTDFAPWHVIESQDKKYGRIQTLELITGAIQERFGQGGGKSTKEVLL
jgi:AMP-polyphosphate phosphotransferase